jgi:16S rRNA (cytosine1402-N4)-methyltransferase
MALRIAVNEELTSLQTLLDEVARGAAALRGSGAWLNPGARVGVISFHSLEDRLVKRAFADLEKRGLGRRLTRRPVTAAEVEIQASPRSRSAKLRVIEIGSVQAPR